MKRAKTLMTGLLAAALCACSGDPVAQNKPRPAQLAIEVDSVTVEAGLSTTVTAVVFNTSEPAQYVSRDQSVATVDASGVITGVTPGSTYVVAAFASGAESRDSVRVRVLEKFPITGVAVPGMESYDQFVPDLLRKYKFPGGAVAVVRDGKLIYARGFGYADVENKIHMQPDALFRIASVSKSLTAVAIMKLVEEGKLKLDDRVAPIIADLKPAPGATVDPRWELITIRNLLNHTGGWDREKPGGFDPIDRSLIAAAAVNAPAPASAETLVRYMKGMPLDFDPGQQWAYSNFGYIILGRVIERLSGMKYEDYVRSRVLQPTGASRTRQGKSHMSDAVADEVKYYVPGAGVNFPMVPSVFPGDGMVPLNYGGYSHETGDASGAWISSTIDLLRFLGAIDGRAHAPSILSAASIDEMTGHGVSLCGGGVCFYGAGFWVRKVDFDATWYHGGDLPGATALLVRTYNNYSWVGLFNSNSGGGKFDQEFDLAMWSALAKVTSFPTHDLFSTFR